MKRRLTAAALAAATALTIATVPAEAQTANQLKTALNSREFLEHVATKGWGAMPVTEGAGNMVDGSIAAGSSGTQAYNATQAGWILTWIAISVAGLGLIGYGAKAAGILPPQVAAALPF